METLFLRICSYEFAHTNFVFVRKTSNLFIRICEGFQHVMLQMACTVGLALALCQYVTGAGFPPRPSYFSFNNRSEESTGTSKTKLTWNMCYETVKKEKISKHTLYR